MNPRPSDRKYSAQALRHRNTRVEIKNIIIFMKIRFELVTSLAVSGVMRADINMIMIFSVDLVV